MRTVGWICVLGLGCEGEDSKPAAIDGFYEVTLRTHSDADCEVEGDPADGAPYFQVTEEEFFAKFYAYGECTSDDQTTCSSMGIFGVVFSEPHGDTWEGRSSAAFGMDPCTLQYDETLAATDGDVLHVEMRRWGEEDASLTGDACSADEAQARGDSMPCLGFDVVEGTRIADAVEPPEYDY